MEGSSRCTICGVGQINNVRHMCCLRCYRRLYKDLGTFHRSQEAGKSRSFKRWIDRVGYRHPGIIKDLCLLLEDPFITLADIGKKHGLSRERIRQLFKSLHGISFGETLNEKQSRKETAKAELGCSSLPHHKVANASQGCSIWKGARSELLVWNKAESLGFNVQVSDNKKYDMKINGSLVDVKACHYANTIGEAGLRPYYRGAISKWQSCYCDFIIMHIPDQCRFYVFPKSMFAGKAMLYLPAHLCTGHDKYGNRLSEKVNPFLEAWHLLAQSTTNQTGGDDESNL